MFSRMFWLRNNIWHGILLLIVLCAALFVPTKPAFAGLADYPTVAVVPFTNKTVIKNDLDDRMDISLARDAADMNLVMTGMFNMIERERLDALIDEMALGKTGLIDEASAAKIGKLLGAQYMVLGSVTSLSTKTKTNSFSGNSYQVFAHVYVRMVEVETGRVVLAGRGMGKSGKERRRAPSRTLHIGTAEVDDEDVHEALEQAADDAITGQRGLMSMLRGGKR